MNKIVLGLIVSMIAICGIVWWVASRSAVSAASYDALEAETDTYIAATFLPGAQNNPIRNELNRMLGESLSDLLSGPERLDRARRGLVLIDELERQVDAIGDTKDSLETRLTALEAELSHVPAFMSGDTGALREHTERLYVIADDIRGLSYRANFHTAEIFEQIIADDGALTAEHISLLNSQIPQVEEQFDTRTNLYAELESIESELGVLYGDLRRSAQGGPLSFFAR